MIHPDHGIINMIHGKMEKMKEKREEEEEEAFSTFISFTPRLISLVFPCILALQIILWKYRPVICLY